MTQPADPSARIRDLEDRQDEALRQLADLERRIAAVLKEAAPPSDSPATLQIAPGSEAA